ncbi:MULTISPECIES: Uma2 family endonuclease [unclassified Streptomyces]|uniref:Uma2 family endonuclease n=1 Tax=unclassified Streptomyces TaxID=2593676 RepID=UPI0021561022|nr:MULTISPECIES: Uma2 family endonuclease [unclassified Streptomyces]
MTAAEPQSAGSWPVPPEGGYTVDDLYRLADLPPHTELIDGSLVFMSPQRDFHSLVIFMLELGLRRQLPRHLRARRETTVVLDDSTAPEPDISVIRAEAVKGLRTTRYNAADVLLAVEVVTPDSASRDRDTKPRKYAAAGIPHFWRVEMSEDDSPVVYVYERDPATAVYLPTGIFHDRLRLTVPFAVDIDLTEVHSL